MIILRFFTLLRNGIFHKKHAFFCVFVLRNCKEITMFDGKSNQEIVTFQSGNSDISARKYMQFQQNRDVFGSGNNYTMIFHGGYRYSASKT